MLNVCLFCRFPIIPRDVIAQKEIEGHQHSEIRCRNCGAEYKTVLSITKGPTKRFVENQPDTQLEKGGKIK